MKFIIPEENKKLLIIGEKIVLSDKIHHILLKFENANISDTAIILWENVFNQPNAFSILNYAAVIYFNSCSNIILDTDFSIYSNHLFMERNLNFDSSIGRELFDSFPEAIRNELKAHANWIATEEFVKLGNDLFKLNIYL